MKRDTGDSSLDENKSEGSWAALQRKITHIIHKAVTAILKDAGLESLWICVLESWILTVQLLSFTFNGSTISIWKNADIEDILGKVRKISQVSYYFETHSWNWFFIYIFISFIFMIKVIIFLIYVARIGDIKDLKVRWPISYLKILLDLICGVLFIPFLDLFLAP